MNKKELKLKIFLEKQYSETTFIKKIVSSVGIKLVCYHDNANWWHNFALWRQSMSTANLKISLISVTAIATGD